MAFKPTASSKYGTRSRSAVPPLPLGPAVVTDVSQIRYSVPDEVRQFPPRRAASEMSVAALQTPAFDNGGYASRNAKLTGQSPRPVHNGGGKSTNPSLPTTYESRDWQSVTKAEYPPRVAELISPEVQAERKRLQASSAVPVGLCRAPFVKSTHSKDFFPRYATEDYEAARLVSHRIGGPHEKCHSDVKTAEHDHAIPGQYQSMAHRQFVKLPSANTDVANAKFLKANSNATHWTFGADKPDYAPVSNNPLPSTAPLIKNRPPSAGIPRDRNPFVAKSAADARPKQMSATAVAAAKNSSSVPLMGNQAEGSASGSILPRHMTANALATPAYTATRREAIDPVAAERAARPGSSSGSKAPAGMPLSSEGLRFGVSSVEYQSMARAQFPGAYFGSLPSPR
jgi:hypothetical protein